jgi:hypothetical protein
LIGVPKLRFYLTKDANANLQTYAVCCSVHALVIDK